MVDDNLSELATPCCETSNSAEIMEDYHFIFAVVGRPRKRFV